jgi:hypothetical protein
VFFGCVKKTNKSRRGNKKGSLNSNRTFVHRVLFLSKFVYMCAFIFSDY